MDMRNENKYEFMILRYPDSPLYSLKKILCEMKICVQGDSITLYSPYNQLYKEFPRKFPGEKMWGIGFRKNIIDRWISLKGLNIKQNACVNLQCRILLTNEIDLKDFHIEDSDFFMVVPDRASVEELCFGEKVENTKYHHWRCKGLNNMYCKNYTDKEIDDYLNKGYRYARRNIIPIDEEQLFPTCQLIKTTDVVTLV